MTPICEYCELPVGIFNLTTTCSSCWEVTRRLRAFISHPKGMEFVEKVIAEVYSDVGDLIKGTANKE